MDSFDTEIKNFEQFLDSKLAIDYGELPEIKYRDGVCLNLSLKVYIYFKIVEKLMC